MYREIANHPLDAKNGERGSALLTVLFISTLLLAAGGALILVTGTASRTAIDATAEMQAYYAAESGLEASLNILRGNVAANAAMPANTKMNFRNAVTAGSSNLPADPSIAMRLSGWLNYNYTPTGAPNPDRVTLTAGYTPTTGLAYSVTVIDPDNKPVASGPPDRLQLRAIGYGPKGAIKRLELIIRRSSFEYNPPCVICLRSGDDGTPINFSTGDSAAKTYSGVDRAAHGDLPTFGATVASDTALEIAAANKNTVTNPIATTISMSSLPPFLQSADEARAFLADQKANAILQGRYFTSFDGYSGSDASPAFTFVDGDCKLDGGAGLLIVTGKLDMKGNPNFSGLILVLGDGYVERDGGGQGNIYGAIAVAHFNKNGSGGFLAPTFLTDGGGNSDVQNDSGARKKAENLTGPRVLGIHEY